VLFARQSSMSYDINLRNGTPSYNILMTNIADSSLDTVLAKLLYLSINDREKCRINRRRVRDQQRLGHNDDEDIGGCRGSPIGVRLSKMQRLSSPKACGVLGV
jgi:hypothetical protein